MLQWISKSHKRSDIANQEKLDSVANILALRFSLLGVKFWLPHCATLVAVHQVFHLVAAAKVFAAPETSKEKRPDSKRGAKV